MSSSTAIEAGSRDPTLEEVLRETFGAMSRTMHVALPGIVQTYDSENNRADIQPAVRDLVPTVEGGALNEQLPVLPNVPIVFPRAGGYFITFPINPGDMVTLVFHERSIEKWAAGESGQVVAPDDFRTHDLSDAVAFPGGYPFSASVSESGFDQHMVLGREGGSTIHIKPDGEVHLGSLDPQQFVALAQKVLDELNQVKADLDAVTARESALQAAFSLPIALEPGNGSPSAFQAQVITALTSNPVPTPHTPQSVAASKVKAE